MDTGSRRGTLFHTLAQHFGQLPFLAEDLGVITPDVEQLRDQLGFPGMRVLQVGLEDIQPDNAHLPENHVWNSVVYPGTHDNNTAVGWYSALSGVKKAAIADYVGAPLRDPAWEMMAHLHGIAGTRQCDSHAGCVTVGQRSAHEHAGHHVRQLALAAACGLYLRHTRRRAGRTHHRPRAWHAPTDAR